MDELIAEFLSEASEGLQTLDNELVELEKNPEDEALLSSIFRVMHTIKGTCGFLGLNKLASIAHAGENIMDKIRNKKLLVTPGNISVILEAIDTIKSIILHISENGTEPNEDYSTLIKKIDDTANSVINVTETSKPKKAKLMEEKTPPIEENLHNIDSTPPIEKISTETKLENKSEHNTSQTIRVNVEVLETLMQIVSELVLNRNQLIQLDRTLRDNRFSAPVQRLNVITSSLQETVMETRMQPIGSAWIKVPRMIRDLSRDLNKKIKLMMIGEETELDRQLIESIKDPLVHMIRNSADHGIESPAERLAAGKSEEGTITLKAYHQGGHIILEVSDDGRGMNLKKIKNKILQNKLATEKDLAAMSDAQITQFIFRAGFSTAEVVTDVSGRGVGMDVVKNNIEDIRGTVELKSAEGKGSTFIIKIPLTLAIMPILVVETDKQKFGLPQINVIEMVRTGGVSEYIIEEINERKVLRLRDSLLPLIILSDILKTSSNSELSLNTYFVVVCEVSGNHFGLVVDKIYDTEEIVLKPVSKLLKSINIYSGNTLLGNGDVIMILDPSGIIKHLTALNHHEDTELAALAEQNKKAGNKLSSFLVLKAGTARKAIPLELVSRLEEIDVTKIEVAGDKPVIQYRESLMFLALLDPKYKMPTNGMQQVVVLGSNDHILGLVVEEILDIIEQDIESSLSFEESDLTALVLGGKTMDVVDVSSFFHQTFFSNSIPVPALPSDKRYNILAVDDSPFFRKIIAALLEAKGFNVMSVKTALEAIDILEKQPKHFHLIITDINMPQMNGFQFATLCTTNENYKHIPIIALTSNAELAATGDHKLHSSGISSCISKTNQNELLQTIYSILKI